jgi:hypothetical protein
MTRIARPRVGQGSPAGMFRCGGRVEVGERGTWEVPVGGLRGESEGNEFFFGGFPELGRW